MCFEWLVDQFRPFTLELELEQLEKTAEDAAKATIAALKPEEWIEMVRWLQERRKGLPMAAAYDNKVVTVATTFLGLGAAGIALVAGFIEKLVNLPPPIPLMLGGMGVAYVNLFVVSLYILLAFVWQARV